ncbi:hypothetical protein Btru_040956 [Bulinus truncatus]|nr:hypothetical protein Btru_040956 [Bulinus truncatus]
MGARSIWGQETMGARRLWGNETMGAMRLWGRVRLWGQGDYGGKETMGGQGDYGCKETMGAGDYGGKETMGAMTMGGDKGDYEGNETMGARRLWGQGDYGGKETMGGQGDYGCNETMGARRLWGQGETMGGTRRLWVQGDYGGKETMGAMRLWGQGDYGGKETMVTTMSILSIYLILMWSVLTYTETASTVTVSPAQRVTGSAVVSGRVVTNSSTTTPSPPSATPSPSWNTSLLCKHLANITSPHGSDPSPTQESLEAKCFPGFVCVNGYCTGGMSCRCNEGWAGLFCQAQCPSNCTPEGTCVTSTSNQAICMCNDTSTYEPGVGCVLRAVDDATTTADPITTEDPKLRSKEERVCFGSMYCIHGYCDIGSMQCLCDPNWKGQLCDEPCDLNCGPHGKCRENTEYIMFCACDLGYTGDRCQTNLYKNISSTTPPTTQRQRQEENVNNMWYSLDSEPTPGTHNTTTVASTTALSENATAVNVISLNVTLINVTTDVSLTLRPLSERECLPGFVCKHGVCYRGGGGGALSCQCDPGYGGAFCDQPCQLDCGTNGSCQASDDKVFCQCLPGFDGVPCKAINIS